MPRRKKDYENESILCNNFEKEETSPAEVETPVPKTVINGKIVNTLHVNVRREPTSDSDVLEILRKGDRVKVLEKGEEFWKVSTSVHRIAYISSNFIEEE